jgi:hypothetical protein
MVAVPKILMALMACEQMFGTVADDIDGRS